MCSSKRHNSVRRAASSSCVVDMSHDLFFDRFQIERSGLLYRRKFNETFGELGDNLLNENAAPQLISKPRIVVDGSTKACAFERVQPNIGQNRKIRFYGAAQPATGLVDEAILVIVYADGAKRCFSEVQDLVALGWPLARDQVHLVVTIKMDLICSVDELPALFQLVDDVGIARSRQESGKPVEPGDNAVLDLSGWDLSRPTNNAWHTEPAVQHRPLFTREWRLSAIGPCKTFSAVVRRKNNDRVVMKTIILQLRHDRTDDIVQLCHTCFIDTPAIFRSAHLLVLF